MKRISRRAKPLFFLLSALLAAVIFIFFFSYFSKPAAAWWDDSWAFRKSIAITAHTATENNVYISTTIDTSDTTKFQTDCGDIRFTKQNGELLPYYIVSGCSSASTVIHVNFDTFPSGSQTIYYYYGNPSVSDGFNLADFATEATNYTVGSLGSEEKSVGPITYWRFDEATGYTAHDSTANNANASFAIFSGTTSPSYNVTQGTPNVGSGADGACSVASDTNINSASCAGRGTADAVNFSSTTNTAAAATSIQLTATSTGLTAGDEVLIINLQRTSGANSDVGEFETKTITSITTTTLSNDTLNFAAGLTNGYDGTTQKIMVQRVPNYTTVTINSGQTLTASAWDGTKNGVLFFRASSTVTVTGSISMAGKGYRYGAKGLSYPTQTSGTQGESYGGTGTVSSAANLGAGGGGVRGNPWDGKNAGGGGGGGGYGTVGSNGLNGSRYCCSSGSDGYGATGGSTYGDTALAKLLLGSGGGGGGMSVNGSGGDGGTGGGIVSVNAATLSVTGTVSANGNNGSPGIAGDGAGGGGGGGSGGSIHLTGTNFTLGSSVITSTAGTGGYLAPWCQVYGKNGCDYTTTSGTGGAGSVGRVAIVATSIDSAPAWQPEAQCVIGRCLLFNGTTTSGSVTNAINGIQTISFWIKPTIVASTSILDLDGGTHTITTNGSGILSANGFASPVYYINGKATTTPTLTVDTWQYVTITTSNGFNSTSSQTLGKVSTSYFKGYLDEVKYYNFAKTADQIRTDMQMVQSTQGSGAVLGDKTTDPLAAGLLGYWKMDEPSGTTTVSDSYRSNTGTSNSSTNVVAGKLGNARSFNGSSQFITVPNNSALNPSAITISAWTYTTDQPSGKNYEIVDKANNSGYRFRITEGGTASWFDQGCGVSCVSGVGTVPLNQWNNIIVTGDSSGLKLYLNGVLTGSTAVAYSGSSTADALEIGRSSAFADYFKGNIDEVRLYNRSLSQTEVTALYNWTPKAPEAPGPVGYYNFEEGSGTTANDTSGDGYTGNFGASTAAPAWTIGKYGNGLLFDGSNDYIGIASNFGKPNTITTSLWFKTTSTSMGGLFGQADTLPTTAPSSHVPMIIMNANGTIRAEYWTGATAAITSTGAYNDGKWHFVSFTGNLSTQSLYVDGIFIGSRAGTIDLSWWTNSTIGTNYIVAARGGSNAYYYFNGSIDDVKIYDYARSASQIVSDMNAGHSAVGSPIGSAVGYWKFDEGADNKCSGGANDACNSGNGGNALDGTETGMSVPATTTSGWTNSGKFGKALIFDGINDYVSIPDIDNSTDFIASQNFSVSFWMQDGGGNTDGDGIVEKWAGTGGYPYVFRTSTTSKIVFARYDGTNNPNTTSNKVITGGAWHHIVGVKDGSSLKLYIDGIFDNTYPDTTTGTTTNTSAVYIASRGGTGSYWKGSVDELKIYTYALTADEVKTEYNRGQSIQLGAAGDNSTYQKQAANQEYCMPGDSTSCAAPVGRWDLEEKVSGDSKTVYDTSGSGGNGATHYGANATGMSCLIPSKVGNSCQFDGADDYIDMGNGTPLQITSSITIEAWVKLTSAANGIYPRIVSKLTGSNYNGYELLITAPDYGVPNSAYLQVANSSTLQNTANTTATVPLNTWTHLTGVYDAAAGKGYLYLNGRVADAAGTTFGSSAIGSSASNVNIGRWSGGTSHYFPGQIDNVKIFNYARTPAQIAWDYNKGGPVGYWKFNECQGATANDSSGNSNPGTITIGASGEDTLGTCATSSTAWGSGVTGKRNASLSFDGTDDVVSLGNNSMLRLSAGGTIAGWIKPASAGEFSYARIIDKSTDTNSTNGFFIEMEGSDRIGLYANGYNNLLSTTNSVPYNQWTHFVATMDGTSWKIYINGVLNNSVTRSTLPPDVAGYVCIGNRANGNTDCTTNTDRTFSGQIDDVKIFNYALTASQVKNEYNGGAIFYGPVTGSP